MINNTMQIGKYRIVEEISSGSFGRVYRAQDTSRNAMPVALKLLHASHLSSSQERNGFLREARFLTLLRYPYILEVLDVGIEQDFPYLVTAYAPNGSLLKRLQQLAPRPLPLNDALTILGQIGQALQYAHGQNIIHRDLKPANILFSANGDALLADFGIATMLANSSEYGTAIGTPYYMAPEQFRGTISKEGDQYALGCIAYELMTGRLPFTAPDFFSLGYKHMSETPMPPSQLNLLISRQVEAAILRAMAKQRGDRFPDIASFLTALGIIIPTIPAIPSTATLPPLPPLEHSPARTAVDSEDDDDGDMTFRRSLSPRSAFSPLSPHGREEDVVAPAYANMPQPVPVTPRPPAWEETGALPVVPALLATPTLTRSLADSLPRDARGSSGAPASSPFARTIPTTDSEDEDPLPAGVPRAKPRRKRRGWFTAAAVFLLLLLLGGGAVGVLYKTNSSFRKRTQVISSTIGNHLHIVPPTPTATVTITPAKKTLSYNYNILAVGSPNSARNQVSSRSLSSATNWQSSTINATGKGTIPATYATGTLSIQNNGPYDVSIAANQGFYDSSKTHVVALSASVSIPVNTAVTVAGHSYPAGSSGNLAALYFNYDYIWNNSTIVLQNTTALAGGQDAQSYVYLQTSDMNAAASAANQLKTTQIAAARAGVMGQIRSGESLFGSVQCTSSVTYNHSAGQHVSNVTTSVSAKCTGEVYNGAAALSLAAGLLQQQASAVPSASYKLLTNIATSIVSVSGASGGILIVVNASSLGLFQFSKGQRQELITLIVNQSEQAAQNILTDQEGVAKATIVLENTSGTTLPGDPNNITITVVNV